MQDKGLNIKSTFRRIFFIQVISSVTSFLCPLVDGIVIGSFLGSTDMAALGFATPICIFFGVFAFILTAGSQAASGIYMGRGQTDKVNTLLSSVFVFGSIISIIFFFACFFFHTEIAVLLGAADECIKPCSDYIFACGFNALPMILTPMLIGFLQMDKGDKRTLISSFTMLVCDIILDLINALVIKGGMMGMGFASTVSFYISLVIVMLHFPKNKGFLRFSITKTEIKEILSVLSVGLPSAFFHICNMVKSIVLNRRLLEIDGTEAVAAFSVQNSITPVALGVVMGGGFAALMICSIIVGEEDRKTLRYTLSYIFKFAFAVSALAGILVFALARPIAFIFFGNASEELTALVVKVVRFFAVSIPLSSVNMILMNYYQSIHKMLISNAICIIDNVVFLLSTEFIASALIGTNGVWLAYSVAEVLMTVSFSIYIAVRKRKIPKSVDDIMLLPDDFGVDDSNSLNISASSAEELIGVSKEIIDFCKKVGADGKTSFFAGLCTEELSIIALSSDSTKKNRYVDIYAYHKNNELTLIMHDNGAPLSPDIFSSEPNEDDIASNAGIRILQKKAKEIKYSVNLDMNVFTLKI